MRVIIFGVIEWRDLEMKGSRWVRWKILKVVIKWRMRIVIFEIMMEWRAREARTGGPQCSPGGRVSVMMEGRGARSALRWTPLWVPAVCPTCYGMFISGTFWGGLRVWVLKYFGVRVGFETGLEVMRADLEPGWNFNMGLSPQCQDNCRIISWWRSACPNPWDWFFVVGPLRATQIEIWGREWNRDEKLTWGYHPIPHPRTFTCLITVLWLGAIATLRMYSTGLER